MNFCRGMGERLNFYLMQPSFLFSSPPPSRLSFLPQLNSTLALYSLWFNFQFVLQKYLPGGWHSGFVLMCLYDLAFGIHRNTVWRIHAFEFPILCLQFSLLYFTWKSHWDGDLLFKWALCRWGEILWNMYCQYGPIIRGKDDQRSLLWDLKVVLWLHGEWGGNVSVSMSGLCAFFQTDISKV